MAGCAIKDGHDCGLRAHLLGREAEVRGFYIRDRVCPPFVSLMEGVLCDEHAFASRIGVFECKVDVLYC